MPATSAQDIIDLAFQTIGLTAVGESPTSAERTDALLRLNQMMGSLRLQPLSNPIPSREVFPVTADLGVYTIGPGGDFDTIRPTRLSGAGILLNSQGTPASVTSIASSAGVATVTQTAHGASTGQNVTIRGASQPEYNGTFPVTVLTSSTYTYLLGDTGVTSPATGTITASFESTGNDVVEVPRAVLTDDAWEAIRIKSLTSAQFTVVYYNATYALDRGTINLWPVPNVATNSLVLYRLMPLTSFASLTAAYAMPDGCPEMLTYNLARRLLTPKGVVDPTTVSDIIEMARSSLATFKRSNYKLTDLPTDPALTHSQSGGYNIVTGQGGGTSG